MITSEQKALVLRLFHAEGWKPSTIAREVGVHRSTVRKILEKKGICTASFIARKRMVESFLPFVKDVLSKHPNISATLLFRMVKARGYEGRNPGHFRKIIHELRPQHKKEAYLIIETLPGEEAQVDWAHCGKLKIGDSLRNLSLFVMVLSHSRRVFMKFFLSQNSSAFFNGFVSGFQYFGGVPRRIIIDNLRSGVCERVGTVIRFNEEFMKLGSHYNIELIAARPRTPTDKGKVERTIRYIRSSFPGLLEPKSLKFLNDEAILWCEDEAKTRKCPGEKTLTVAERFEKERQHLLPLPATPFDAHEIITVNIPKRPYAKFDGNEYSVPPDAVGTTLTIHAYESEVIFERSGQTVAQHTRSWDRGCRIENQDHIVETKERKKFGQKGAALASLEAAFPGIEQILQTAANRGENIGNFVSGLILLRSSVGDDIISLALQNASHRQFCGFADLRREIDAIQLTRRVPPPIPEPIPLPEGFSHRKAEITSLDQYKIK